MIITKAMPTQQSLTTGVSRHIVAGQEIKTGQCRGPGPGPPSKPQAAHQDDVSAAGIARFDRTALAASLLGCRAHQRQAPR